MCCVVVLCVVVLCVVVRLMLILCVVGLYILCGMCFLVCFLVCIFYFVWNVVMWYSFASFIVCGCLYVVSVRWLRNSHGILFVFEQI